MAKLIRWVVALVVLFLLVILIYGHRPSEGLLAGEGAEAALPRVNWSFEGVTGTFDPAARQRGYQVYEEVCSKCHSLSLLHYGDLGPDGPGGGIGYSEDAVRAFAAQKQVTDGPNDAGEMFQRPGRPADRFVAPFSNEKAARAALNGALPPDLSLIVKARDGGATYLYALLTGYKDQPPAGITLGDGLAYNEYFLPNHQIAMPQPLAGDEVNYADGTKATQQQEAADVATFLAWAAEPTLEQRKRTGIKVLIFLVVMTLVLYAAKRKIWSDVH